MKTLEDLKLEYNNLDKEAGKYNHPEFTKVYEIIADLIKDRNDVGDKGNFAFPLVTGSVIDEALTKLGFDKNKKFVSDFKKYREIEQKARDIQLEAIKHPVHSVQIILNEPKTKKSGNWRFVPTHIIVPEFMSDIINQKLCDDVKNVSGLYSVTTDVLIEDESDDNFLAIEAFGVRSSLEPYYRELQEYKIFETYFNYEDLKKYFLTMLLEIITYISNNTASPNKIRNRISSIIKEFDKLGGIGIIWQILILQGIVRWIENINISKEDYGYKELENLLNWVYKFLMEKLVFYSYYNWGDKELIYLEPLCNYLYSTEVGKEVQQGIFKDDEISRQTEDMRKLEELNSSEDIKDSPSISYIDKIKINTLKYGDGWANGKSGQIADLSNNYQLRFLETDENGLRFLQNEEEKIKLPIIACGFVAWLIKHWKEDTKTIFENYLKIRLNQYVDLHKNAPDAHKRDLEKDFFRNYLSQEEKWIKQSEAIFEFITEKEVETLKEYIQNYREYVAQKCNPLYIDEYTKQSEIIIDTDWRIKLAYHIFLNYHESVERFSLVARTNDVKRILKHHIDKPDECLQLVLNKYQTALNIGTVFIECLKYIIDEKTIFMKLLNNQPITLHKGTQDDIKNIFGKFRIETGTGNFENTPTFTTQQTAKINSPQKTVINTLDNAPKRTIDIARLQSYFVSDFYNPRKNPINYFDKLTEELENDFNKIEFAQISYMIYTSEQMNRTKKTATYAEWYKIFCNIIGISAAKDYGKENKVKNIKPRLKHQFYYL